MYKIIEWNEKLDLSEFYAECSKRGFINNSSQKMMIDCFKNEKEWNAWILYKDSKAIGSVVVHSFDDMMGPNSYRILARTCVLDGVVNGGGLGTPRKYIQQHQNITCQFFIPLCIEWCGKGNKLYATSNESKEASQKLVHNIYFPLLAKQGEFKKIKNIYYRYTNQTVWQLDPDKFLENLSKYPRWN